MANEHAQHILSGSHASSQSATVYQPAIVSTHQAFCDLEQEWNELAGRQQGPVAFQSHGFCLTWLERNAFCQNARYDARVVTLRNTNDELVAVLPLTVTKAGFPRIASWIGEPLIQYGDALIDPRADAPALRAVLSDAIGDGLSADIFSFENVRRDSRIAALLELDRYRVGNEEEAAIVKLDEFSDFDDFMMTFSSRSRKNRRKKRRSLEALGTLTFSLSERGESTLHVLDTALRWKKEWLAERGITSRAFLDENALNTLLAFTEADKEGRVAAGVLRLEGAPIAIEFGFLDDYGYQAFMGAYNPAYESASAGKICMEDMVRALMDRGIKRYDLLAPNTDYKRQWANDYHPVANYVVPLTVVGALYSSLYLNYLRPRMKVAVERAPRGIKQAVTAARKAFA